MSEATARGVDESAETERGSDAHSRANGGELGTATRPLAPEIVAPSVLDAPDDQLSYAPDSRRDSLRRRLLALADVVGILTAYGVVWLLDPPPGTPGDRLALLGAIPLWVLLNKLLNLYDRDANLLHKSTLHELPRIVQSVVLGAALIFLLAEPLVGIDVQRDQTLLFIASACLVLPILRFGARSFVHARFEPERCLLVGSGEAAEMVARKVAAHPDYGVTIVGYVDLDADEAGEHEAPRQLRLLGDTDRLNQIRREYEIERVVIAFSPHLSHAHLLEVIQACKRLNLKVAIVPRFFELIGRTAQLDEVEGLTLLGLSGLARTHSSLLLKRAMDLIGAGLGLFVLSPLLIPIAIAIRLDSPGPVFFRQRRIGRDDEPFELLKFRTMVAEADERKQDLLELNEAEAPMFKIADDPRITRVGGWLRARSLDELPQLVNVVKGEMSLVGPRPLVPDEAEHVSGGWRRVRLDQPPGMTGPWQVLGRNAIPFDEMVTLDYVYLADWSLWHDFVLILRTIPVVLRGRGH